MPTATRRVKRPPPRGAIRAVARQSATAVYRDAILQAARDEFMDRGYAATKMVDIARRAGMSVGGLYNHFDNKEAIFVSIMQRASERVTEQMRTVGKTVSQPRARVRRLVETMLQFIEENRGMFLVFHQLADADRAHCRAMVAEKESTRDQLFAVYRAAIADGIASGDLRRDVAPDYQLAFLTGTMHGFLEAWIQSGGETGLVDKAPLIADLTLRALGGPS